MKLLKTLLVFTFLFLTLTETRVMDINPDFVWADIGQLRDVFVVHSFVVYHGDLYAGTYYGVYRHDGGTKWTDVGGCRGDEVSLVVYAGNLYCGSYSWVYRYDEERKKWIHVGNLEDVEKVTSFAVYDGKLYAGTRYFHREEGYLGYRGHVFRYDGGTTWTEVGQLGGLGYFNYVLSLAVFDGKLYAATYESQSGGGHVYRYDGGATWTDLGQLGYEKVYSLAVYEGNLYAGTDFHVYRYGVGDLSVSLETYKPQYDRNSDTRIHIKARVKAGENPIVFAEITATLRTPSGSVQDLEFYDNKDGTYSAYYRINPSTPLGRYIVNVKVRKLTYTSGESALGFDIIESGGCEALIEDKKGDLADRFSPYMYFYNGFPAEKFRPTTIDDMLDNSGLWKLEIHSQPPPDRTQLQGKPVTPDYISQFQNEQSVYYYLDLLDDETGDYVGGMENLETERKKLYARVTCDEYGGKTWVVLQYWFFYLYNDFTWDNHEGEWEMIEILIDFDDYEQYGIDAEPEWAIYSRHTGGEWRSWVDVEKSEGTHPVVYVAEGSHAAYFIPGKYYLLISPPFPQFFDYAKGNGIPDKPLNIEIIDNELWLSFGGNWGYVHPSMWQDGPLGPKYQGEKWLEPVKWGLTVINPSIWVGEPNIVLSLASPADMLITNSQGQKLGYVNGEFVQEIPESYINSIGDEEIYLIPTNDVYTVQIFGTGDGIFNFAYELESWDQSKMLAYTNIPVNPNTVATMRVGEFITDYTMEIDNDGDGIVDQIITSNVGVSLSSPNSIQPLQNMMNYEITIKNEGTSLDTFNLESSLPDDWIGNFSQSSVILNAGESATVVFSVSTPSDVEIKDYTMKVIAYSQTDTGLSASLNLIASSKPELTLSSSDISLSFSEGNDVTISANIHNLGRENANNVQVQFFNGNPDFGGALIGEQTINSITSGSTGTASILWNVEDGIYDIYVVIDPNNVIEESSEHNNMAFKTFVVDRTPPEIMIDGVYDGQMVLYEELAPVINVTDNLDSSPTITINLNGIPFNSGTTITEVGIYNLEVSAVDASGNSASVSIQFTIANEQMWIGNMKQMISDLPDNAFKNNPDQRKNAFINDLNAVLQQIGTGNYNGAIQKLQNDIRVKMDGCFGGNANNDWIVDCEAQEILLERIDRLIEYLQGLGLR